MRLSRRDSMFGGIVLCALGFMLVSNLVCLVSLAMGYWQPLVAEGVFCFVVGSIIFARI